MRTKALKKYMLLATTLLSTATFADNFYLKGGVGLNSLNPFKIREEELEGKAKLMQSFPLIEAGVGYNFSNRIRTEIAFDYYFMFNVKESFNSDHVIVDSARKTKINALFLNSTIDIIKFKKASIFLGGGIGSSFQKERASILLITDEGYSKDDFSTKQINQFSHKLTIGVDFKLREDLTGELSYNYFDLGKSRKNYRYKLHNLTLGIRYAL